MMHQRRSGLVGAMFDTAHEDIVIPPFVAGMMRAFEPGGEIGLVEHGRAVGRLAQRQTLETLGLGASGEAQGEIFLTCGQHMDDITFRPAEVCVCTGLTY